MKKILLNDLLNLDEKEIKKAKVKFNLYNGKENPLDLYKKDPESINTSWLLWHKNARYFNEGQIAICLLRLSYDVWLLTTVKKITKKLDVFNDIGYEAQEIREYEKFFGRIVVKYHNTNRTIGRNFNNISSELEVIEILNDKYTGSEFPGYENVRLSYSTLETILERNLPDWIAALRNQKAVYLITDTKTGKLYVGSATAQEGMLLQRWSNYINNGHGGNKDLIRVVREQGFDYIKENFQYSILENYNARMDDDYILKREKWWKDTLKSREFGYNKN